MDTISTSSSVTQRVLARICNCTVIKWHHSDCLTGTTRGVSIVADVRLLMMALRTMWMKHMAPSCAIQEAQSPCSVPGMISWLVDGRPTGWSLTTCVSAQNNTRHVVLFRCITLHVLVPWFITTALATVVYLRHLFKKFWKNCSWKIDKFLLKVTCTEQSKRISMHKL